VLNKQQLQIGQVLHHRMLGDVVYTETCHVLECLCPEYGGLYVYHDGDEKCVTLPLVSIKL
jgi:hypothetical protein